MADAPSESSLQILGGALNGRRFVFPETADEVTIGADPDCSFALDVPGISPLHARLLVEADGWYVYDCRAPQGLYLNDNPVDEKAALNDGDFLWLGEPGGDGAVMVQVRLAPVAAPLGFAEPESTPEFAVEDESVEEIPAFAHESADDVAADAYEAPAAEEMPAFADEAPAYEAPTYEAANEGYEAPPAEAFAYDEAEEAPPADDAPLEMDAPVEEAIEEMPDGGLGPEEGQGTGGGFTPAPEPIEEMPVDWTPEAAPEMDVFAAPPAPAPAPAARKIQKHDTSGMGWEPIRDGSSGTPGPPPGPPPPATAARPAPAPTPARRDRGGPSPAVLGGGIAAVLVLAVGGYFAWGMMKTPKAGALSPSRASAGEVVTLTGENFAADVADNVVKVGSATARVKSATETRIQFELPATSGGAGKDQKLVVTVEVGGRVSNPVELSAYERPRIQALKPDVAQAGDVIEVSGSGWTPAAEVRFGAVKAEQVVAAGEALQATVPALDAQAGAAIPVTVGVGKDVSAPATLLYGRLPLVIARNPQAAQPGQQVTLAGRGFKPGETRVTVDAVPALLAAVTDDEIQMIVPRLDADGAAELRIEVTGLEPASGGAVTVSQGPGGLLWRFVPEPVVGADAEGKQTVALASAFGPTLVLSASGHQSAAQRALEAQKKLVAAGEVIAATPGLEVQARGLDKVPQVGLAGRPDVLLEPTDEDAAYYARESGGKGGPVTRARVAVWWAAVLQDLVLATIRKDAPRYAATLSPEGKVLAEAQKLLGTGATPHAGMARLRDGLRVVATRIPAGVKDPAVLAAATPEPPALVLDGDWRGKEVEKGAPKFVSITFKTKGSTFAYQTGLTMSTPIKKYEVRKGGKVYFMIGAGNKLRHYLGTWNGKEITGKIAASESGAGEIGTFELTRQ